MISLSLALPDVVRVGFQSSQADTAPVNTGLPAVTGTGRIGQVLTAGPGVWSGFPAPVYSYQWQRNGTAIAGATGTTYTPVAADDLASVRVRVTATNAAGTASATSAAVTVTHVAPVASGTVPAQGYTQGVAIAPLSFAGYFAGSNLSFGLAPSSAALPAGLSLSAAGDLSGTPTVLLSGAAIVVRATNSGGTADQGFSLTVAAANQAPVNTGLPAVTGTGRIGQVLTAGPGVWSGFPAPVYSYQWQRNGTAIAGATGTTYTPVAADDLASVRVRVTATNAAGTASATSAAVTVTHVAPVASGTVPAQVYTQGVAIAPLSFAGYFAGSNLSFGLAPSSAALPAGLSLSAAGDLSGTPTVLLSGAAIVVRATNSGGTADQGFSLTVAAANQAPVGLNQTLGYTVTAGDVIAPILASAVPADDATNVAINVDPALTFSEPIAFGTGLITLRNVTDGVDTETFDVATEQGTSPGQVSISGAVLTIRPTADLANGKTYAIRIASTAITDAVGNAYPGIADDTTLNFGTVAAASGINLKGYANGTLGFGTALNITSPAVAVGDNIITLVRSVSARTITISGHTSLGSISDGGAGWKLEAFRKVVTGASSGENVPIVIDTDTNASAQVFALSGGSSAVFAGGAQSANSGDYTLPTVSVSTGAIIVAAHMVTEGGTTTITAPAGAPTTEPGSYPATQGYFVRAQSGQSDIRTLALTDADGGTSTTVTVNYASYLFRQGLTVGINP